MVILVAEYPPLIVMHFFLKKGNHSLKLVAKFLPLTGEILVVIVNNTIRDYYY